MTHTVQSQSSSKKGRFQVDYRRGCTGTTITITQIGTFSPAPVYWYENLVGSFTSTLSHTYNTAGSFYIVQLVNDASLGTDNYDSLLVEILEPQNAEFTIHKCANHKVRVETANDYYDRYEVDFDGLRTDIVNPNSFTNEFDFGSSGVYNITVTGILTSGNSNCGSQVETVSTVTSLTPPLLSTVEVIDQNTSGSILLTHTLDAGVDYNLYYGNGDSKNLTLQGSISSNQTNISPINTATDYHCYQLESFDVCNGDSYKSEVICSIILDTSSDEKGNRMNWSTDNSNAKTTEIIRDNSILINLPTTSSSHTDSLIVCNKDYSYQVQQLYQQGKSLSMSSTITASNTQSLPIINGNPSSTFSGDSVIVTWDKPNDGEIPFDQYVVQRKVGNRDWSDWMNTTELVAVDKDIRLNQAPSYRVSYSDDCENESTPSIATTPVVLAESNNRGKIITYEWNRYEEWQNGIQGYTLEQLDESGNILEEFEVLSGRSKSIDFSNQDPTDKYLRIKATSLDSPPVYSYSNVITTKIETVLYFPTAFTPDEDGVNDTFVHQGPAIADYKLDIYNRWGNQIYSTTDKNYGWDGTDRTGDSPQGTYLYKVYFTDLEGRSHYQNGVLTLFRYL